jgi:hypothetical protein
MNDMIQSHVKCARYHIRLDPRGLANDLSEAQYGSVCGQFSSVLPVLL